MGKPMEFGLYLHSADLVKCSLNYPEKKPHPHCVLRGTAGKLMPLLVLLRLNDPPRYHPSPSSPHHLYGNFYHGDAIYIAGKGVVPECNGKK